MICADCGHVPSVDDRPIDTMITLRAPTGDWHLCSTCMRASLLHAEQEREDLAKRIADRERKAQRQTHQRERVGSH